LHRNALDYAISRFKKNFLGGGLALSQAFFRTQACEEKIKLLPTSATTSENQGHAY